MAGEAGDGQEGIREIERLRPDIVITDITMPVMDGLKMIAETKERYDYAAIILTGYSEFSYAMEAIRNGVSGYVLKPLDMEEFKETLGQAIAEVRNIRLLRQQNERREELRHISLMDSLPKREEPDAVTERILSFIADKYQSKIILADLAQALHYSERYINQKFQKATGTTVIEYLNRYRIQKALELLQEGKLPLSDIGWECGIGEYKYFNHVFKKYMGCSAREYQNKIRQD